MMQIYPSLMVVKRTDLEKEIAQLQPLCIGFHIDIMDNIFVQNTMWNNPGEINNLVTMITSPWIHLMVENPDIFYASLTLPINSLVSFHIESNANILDLIKTIKEKKHRVSIAIRPKTPISTIIPFCNLVDHILLMSVEPGFSGQQFLDSTWQRLEELVSYRKQYNPLLRIGIDGGITAGNIQRLAQNGVDDCAIATALFQTSNHVATLQELQKLARR